MRLKARLDKVSRRSQPKQGKIILHLYHLFDDLVTISDSGTERTVSRAEAERLSADSDLVVDRLVFPKGT